MRQKNSGRLKIYVVAHTLLIEEAPSLDIATETMAVDLAGDFL